MEDIGYDGWLRCGTLPLVNLRPGEFIFFSCCAMVGLVPPVSSFLLMLLEFYELQLQHLSPHPFVLVVIFINFCEMFVRVWPSVPLFWMFHVLRWARKGTNPVGTYYF
jgi:hypothetical protein